MMEVEQSYEQADVSSVLATLLSEFSTVTDYRTLRDSLPRRLTFLLHCQCVLLYQRVGETLQFVAGSCGEQPGWSTELLTAAHINPINLSSNLPEVCAWRERHAIAVPHDHPTLVAVPLLYRLRGIGVLVAMRADGQIKQAGYWTTPEVLLLEAIAGVVALMLENTRLLERDQQRIHELSLLNSISRQMNDSMYDLERLRSIVIQRTKEISTADLCELLEPTATQDTASWIPPSLRTMLFRHFHEQRSFTPLIIERPAESHQPDGNAYLAQLPATIKTFFALPLFSSRIVSKRPSSLLPGTARRTQDSSQEPAVPAIIVGAYHRVWKLRREELVLLQVLANQASAARENMELVVEVVEARNEAHKLLHQVLEDQRFKELILESIPSGLITTDEHGYIVTFNRAAEAMLGCHPYEALGQPLHKILNLQSQHTLPATYRTDDAALLPQQPEGLPNAVQRAMVERETVSMTNCRGQEIVLEVDSLPLRDDKGAPVGVLATFTDVTSIHRMEEEKRRMDRLASLGEMATNVAHEVRNPLASIKTSVQMLMDDLSNGNSGTSVVEETHTSWAQESVSMVLQEVERLDAIVRDLLLFAGPRHLHRVMCNIVELSDHILHLLHSQCVEANVVVHRVYDHVPPLRIDIAQIEQVLLNLYMNALQAMPEGGVLTVTCHTLRTEQGMGNEMNSLYRQYSEGEAHTAILAGRCHSLYEASVQNWVEIAISDTGVGIPADQLERIFQPFFTTKAHGIGLGLAITRRLVEDHGGYLRVESQLGYGATIAVRLPLDAADPGGHA